jgi:DNA-binding MarR family transcriptional regulator
MPQKLPESDQLQRIDEIDRTVHSPTRLKILIVLAAVISADFTFLTLTTGLTRGNISANLRKLEEAGYVSIEKGFADRVPRTMIELTDAGRAALHLYNENMRAVLDELKGNLN